MQNPICKCCDERNETLIECYNCGLLVCADCAEKETILITEGDKKIESKQYICKSCLGENCHCCGKDLPNFDAGFDLCDACNQPVCTECYHFINGAFICNSCLDYEEI